jgi:hypothetical protein
MSKDDFKVEYTSIEKTSKETEDKLFLALSKLINYEDLNSNYKNNEKYRKKI